MGWLNTMLDIGIIGLQMNQRSKLEQLQSQHGKAAAIQAIVRALREEIFKYKQNAEEVLVLERENPKIAAGAMRLLEVRLQDFGLTPDMFPEIPDKEYVAATTKLIQENSKRMALALSSEDQAEIEQIAHDALMQPRYNYYLNNYRDVQAYREAQNFVKSKAFFNNGFVGLIIIMPAVFVLVFLVSSLFGLIFNSPVIGMYIGLVVIVIGLLYFQKNIVRKKEYKESQKTIKSIENRVDLELFTQAERELGKDPNQIAKLNADSERRLRNFFEGKTAIVSLPESSSFSNECRHCGTELPPKGKFCIKCGQPT